MSFHEEVSSNKKNSIQGSQAKTPQRVIKSIYYNIKQHENDTPNTRKFMRKEEKSNDLKVLE